MCCLRYGILDGGLGLTGYSHTFEGFDEDVEEKVLLLMDVVVTTKSFQVVDALPTRPEGLRLEIRTLTLVSFAVRGGYKVGQDYKKSFVKASFHTHTVGCSRIA